MPPEKTRPPERARPPEKTGFLAMTDPSPWISRFAPLVAGGCAVLDLASGSGRHGRFFLGRGHPVTLVDRDTTPLADLQEQAEIITADLEQGDTGADHFWPLTGRTFGAVVVTNYLYRPLFPHLAAALEPGGILLYETFARGNEQFGRPRNPAHLLEPGELLTAFAQDLTIIAYENGLLERCGGPRVVERLCAVKGAAVLPLPH